MPTGYVIRDGARQISFTGEILASVSSAEPGKDRWIELTLYSTESGTYVLHGCGVSIREGEVDRHWVQLADEPTGIIDRLYMISDEGARYIPTTSRKLLEAASDRDPLMCDAYMREHIA